MKIVLFVDDEKTITRSLKQLFDDNEFIYVFKNSGQEAIQFLREHPVDLLCTDLVMPGLDGHELLRLVKKDYPNVIRVALASMHQQVLIKKLVDENLSHLYMFKPWHDNELKINIFKILNMQTALFSHDLITMVNTLDSLPTIPKLYFDIVEAVKKECNVNKIASMIEQDISTTSVILKVANSAYFGRKTGNISQAVMNIGLDSLKTIVLANAVFQEFTDDMEALQTMWQHATLCNKYVTAIYSECLKKSIPSIFASAGLLHDIGKVVMYHGHKDYMDLLNQADNNMKSLIELEKAKYGVSHEDLGGYLLNHWDLPYAYVEAAMFHHKPMDHRIINKELIAVVHMAHYYSERTYVDGDNSHLDHKVFKILDLDKIQVEAMLKDRLNWRAYD